MMTKMTALTDDPATAYARAVCDGEIIAGPSVRLACKRHFADLEAGIYKWDLNEVKRALDWYPKYLRLVKGRVEGRPFKLFPWQSFVIGSIYGWVDRNTGFRRYREAYLEIGKGSGKSPLVAGMGLRGLCYDRENRAQVYVIARHAEQAEITFGYAADIALVSPKLADKVKVFGGSRPHRIEYKFNRMRRESTDRKGEGKSGITASTVLIDEYHEHATSTMRDSYGLSVKERDQPILIIITNAGVDMTSPCGLEHSYAKQVVAGDVDNPTYFSFICDLDKSDEPFEDESCWVKTNPSLPAIPGHEYIRNEVNKARGMPSKRTIVERLLFCRWVEAESPWLDRQAWERCETDNLSCESERTNKPCWLAVDLSLKTDLSAVAAIWRMKDEVTKNGQVIEPAEYESVIVNWTPKEGLYERSERDQTPYMQWVNQGYLRAIEGPIIDYGTIADYILEMVAKYNVRGVAFDPYKIHLLEKELEDRGQQLTRLKFGAGLYMVRHGQSFVGGARRQAMDKSKLSPFDSDKDELNMPRSIDATEDLILSGNIKVEYNPVVRSAAMSIVVIQDASLNRRLDKRKTTKKIDAMVALVMGCGFAVSDNVQVSGLMDDENFSYDEFLSGLG